MGSCPQGAPRPRSSFFTETHTHLLTIAASAAPHRQKEEEETPRKERCKLCFYLTAVVTTAMAEGIPQPQVDPDTANFHCCCAASLDETYCELLSAIAEEDLVTVNRIYQDNPSLLRRKTSNAGHSIVHVAAMHRSVQVLRFVSTLRQEGRRDGPLLSFGEVGLDGMGALHLACSQGSSGRSSLETVQIICGMDVDISVQDGQGRTPIHISAERGVSLLVKEEEPSLFHLTVCF
jgi:hypothetical protein